MPPARLAGLAAALLVALQASTQTFAWLYRYHVTLGPALRLDETGVYWPWMILVWRQRFGTAEADAFALPLSVFMLVMAAGAGGLLLFDGGAVKRTRGWGGLAEARRAGLLHDAGCVLGRLQGRLLATTDLRPTLVTGGTRAGKGRGHVVPTLLSWTDSVLVHDPKGELWRVTAGWRAQHSHAIYFNPRDPASARFNPLAEIRPGPQELAQVQRLVAILSDPGGARDDEAIWDKAASEILEAVILHVLYTAPDADKTLLTVRTILAEETGQGVAVFLGGLEGRWVELLLLRPGEELLPQGLLVLHCRGGEGEAGFAILLSDDAEAGPHQFADLDALVVERGGHAQGDDLSRLRSNAEGDLHGLGKAVETGARRPRRGGQLLNLVADIRGPVRRRDDLPPGPAVGDLEPVLTSGPDGSQQSAVGALQVVQKGLVGLSEARGEQGRRVGGGIVRLYRFDQLIEKRLCHCVTFRTFRWGNCRNTTERRPLPARG